MCWLVFEVFGSLVLFFVWRVLGEFFWICCFGMRNGYVVGGLIVSWFLVLREAKGKVVLWLVLFGVCSGGVCWSR